jgi:hypothetical protein
VISVCEQDTGRPAKVHSDTAERDTVSLDAKEWIQSLNSGKQQRRRLARNRLNLVK